VFLKRYPLTQGPRVRLIIKLMVSTKHEKQSFTQIGMINPDTSIPVERADPRCINTSYRNRLEGCACMYIQRQKCACYEIHYLSPIRVMVWSRLHTHGISSCRPLEHKKKRNECKIDVRVNAQWPRLTGDS